MIPFVDAHVHFWDLGRIAYPWLTPPFDDAGPNGSVAAIAHDYLPDDYRADLTGWDVRGAVHVDAGAAPDWALDETRWLEEQAARTGLPDAIVAFAPLDDPGVDSLLARQAAYPRVRGIRQIVNWHPDPRRSYTPRDLTRDEGWQAGYRLLARHGLSFDLQCYPAQMPGLVPLIAATPGTPVIVNHLGMPVPDDADGVGDWRRGMRALAAMPHVAVKLSGLGFIDRNWTIDRVRPFVREAIDLFGTDRCMVASDLPTDKLFAAPHRYLDTYRDLTADLSSDEVAALFAGNANRFYRLGLALQEPAHG